MTTYDARYWENRAEEMDDPGMRDYCIQQADAVRLRDAKTRTEAALADAATLREALYYLGGGDVYIEMGGRLCFCPVHGRPGRQHSSSCDWAWNAYARGARHPEIAHKLVVSGGGSS